MAKDLYGLIDQAQFFTWRGRVGRDWNSGDPGWAGEGTTRACVGESRKVLEEVTVTQEGGRSLRKNIPHDNVCQWPWAQVHTRPGLAFFLFF